MLLPVGYGQQLRGGNEALNDYIKPNFKNIVKQKNRRPTNCKFNYKLLIKLSRKSSAKIFH